MPQIFNTFEIARPSYYDRNPISVIQSYVNTIGPHADTVRASYSPPYLFAAFIEHITFTMLRATPAASAAQIATFMKYLPFQGGSFYGPYCSTNTNVPYQQIIEELTSWGYMAYGDSIEFHTQDLSTGGLVFFNLGAKGTEFQY